MRTFEEIKDAYFKMKRDASAISELGVPPRLAACQETLAYVLGLPEGNGVEKALRMSDEVWEELG